MIQQIKLKNFKGHKDSTIAFTNGVNVITGSSSAGKSSILAGVRWILENRPSGDELISHWNLDKKDNPIEDTSCEIITDSTAVKRLKNKDLNAYIVDDVELKCVGRDVPEQVTIALPLSKLNIHRQLEPHFLLSDSAGDVAKYLNSLIGLTLIDTMMTKANKDNKDCKDSILTTETIITTAKKTIEELAWVEKAEQLWNEIEEYTERKEVTESKHNELYKLIDEYTSITSTMERNAFLLVSARYLVDKVNEAVVAKTTTDNDMRNLQNLISEYEKAKEVVDKKPICIKAQVLIQNIANLLILLDTTNKEFTDLTNLLRSIEISKKVADKKTIYTKAINLIKEIESMVVESTKVTKAISDIENTLNTIRTTEETIAKLKVELANLRSQLPKVCPSCGQEILEDK